MKILLMFRFFQYILFIDSENLCFILILEEKWQVLTLNIVHFPNFEMSATPHARVLIRGNTVFENKSDKTI